MACPAGRPGHLRRSPGRLLTAAATSRWAAGRAGTRPTAAAGTSNAAGAHSPPPNARKLKDPANLGGRHRTTVHVQVRGLPQGWQPGGGSRGSGRGRQDARGRQPKGANQRAAKPAPAETLAKRVRRRPSRLPHRPRRVLTTLHLRRSTPRSCRWSNTCGWMRRNIASSTPTSSNHWEALPSCCASPASR